MIWQQRTFLQGVKKKCVYELNSAGKRSEDETHVMKYCPHMLGIMSTKFNKFIFRHEVNVFSLSSEEFNNTKYTWNYYEGILQISII